MEERGPLKLCFIHFLAAGHMIPLCDIATLFASRGQHVTIITTPSNAQILRKSIPSQPFLRLHSVHFPSEEVGLPDGVENISSVSDLHNLTKVFEATAMLQPPIEHFVEQQPPDCIVADFLFPWVHDLANRLNIPRLVFNGFSLFAICAIHSASPDSLVISTLPHPITMNASPPKELTEFLEKMLETALKSYGFIVNNFTELEGQEYIQYYEKTTGHRAWHLGPASLIRRSAQEKAERGMESVVSMHECVTWLDSKPDNSVVYICFGSLCHFPDHQLYEIACGIQASDHAFIWVVPEKKGKEQEQDEDQDQDEKWLPKGFHQRNAKKGMIIRGWAPQMIILGHPAIGCFVTHCGWNSTLEAVSAGIPMLTWPVHGEQFYNEKLITEVRGIGVEVGAAEWTSIGFGERHKLVSRDSIEKGVRRLMDAGDEAMQIRRRAQEFAQKAREAVREGGSSHNNLTALIDDLILLRDAKL
ncbi:hypothetical protein VNO78_22616 [Psophocarpus tetragonolobus]|uniref:Glycosyltransferase n=1 Tax=Psophocarpus tetragonolobus TaxID=3891 RepID=A0AAN9XCC6_PSOTE